MLTVAQKIQQIIDWGAVPYRIAKDTGVPNNTIVRIWSGETSINSIKLENAEKISAYYDDIERNISEAITILDWLIGKLDAKRSRLTNNQNLLAKVKDNPYQVFEHLREIVNDSLYSSQLPKYQEPLQMITKRINTIEVDIIGKITVSDLWTLYAHRMEQQLNELYNYDIKRGLQRIVSP